MNTRGILHTALISWALLIGYNSGCTTPGWFGYSCQYQCRCNNNNCDSDGQCTNVAGCVKGWFGPACQYVDLAYYGTASNGVLKDGNDNTCIQQTNLDRTTFTLNDSYTFTWLRVRASKPDFLHDLTVTFNSTISCANPMNASVDDTTLDIYCELKERVKSVTLTGKGVHDLCSVYISGGRNVALKQNATQSTTLTWNYKIHPAESAVDGDRTRDFDSGNNCSCTDGTKLNPNWTVWFSNPQSAHRYIVYNRDGDSGERLKGFTLESFDANNSRLFNYTDRQFSRQPVYTIFGESVTLPISHVTIQVSNIENILTLCEVEVYGDSVCEPRQYGRECEHKCNCAVDEACFVSTGGCPSGCPVGLQGENCNKTCAWNTWGERCSSNCSKFCIEPNDTKKSSCNNVNGECQLGCEHGYKKPHCEEACDPGRYGLDCQFTCNEKCVSNISDERSCDHVNGTCIRGCETGYMGSTCISPCPYGKYGHECNLTCDYCIDTNTTGESPCDNVDGNCKHGCVSGISRPECEQRASSPGGSDNTSVIIGAVVGSVLGVIVVVAVILGVVFFCKRRHNITKSDATSDHLPDLTIENRISQKPSAKRTLATKEQRKDTENISNGVYYNSIGNVSPPSTAVSLDELEDYMASRSKDFFKDQFNAIPANEQATMTAGMSSENKTKNRYKNVCAYDHSRVHLIPNTGKKQGDYINASYVEGYKPDEKFIASQGPTKIILEDFVRMLWEQEVEKVVMLTNLVEEGKHKCERYWPEDDEMRVGEITIKLATTKVFADYTIRILQLRKEGKPPQDLTHYHFTSWPDKDIPTAPWGLVDFEQRVAAHSTSRPIVVHCSAGIGRTGTFIALRNVMRQAEETGSMDFFKTVQKLRHDRINMVQTAEQYIFLHKAAQVAMLCIGTTVTSFDIQNRIKTLQTKSQTGETRMEKEFKAICSACDEKEEEKKSEENPYSVYENSQNLLNRKKNRLSNILAKEMYRAILMNENSDVEDYINAVLVPSFTKQNQQILTQLPLPTTVTDFWRLVTQYKVALIVAFQVDLKTTDQTIGNYLPTDENEPLTSSMFEIRTEPKTVSKFWIQQKLVVAVDTEKMSKVTAVKIIDKEHHVTHLTCTTTDLDSRAMLTITEYVRSLKPAGDRRILYMCRNGANYSGMLCVLHLLLDRIDSDGCLTVPLVVGAMKAIRPQVIPTLDQYKHLYEALQLYAQSTNEYSNFGSSST